MRTNRTRSPATVFQLYLPGTDFDKVNAAVDRGEGGAHARPPRGRMTREKQGGRERETNVLGARKFISPRGGRGCKPRDGWIFGTMGARGGRGRR